MGHNFGAGGDLLVSLSYQHRSALRTIDRDWSQYPLLENTHSWQSLTSPISNPGTLVFQRPVAGVQTSYSPVSAPNNLLHMSAGGSIRDVGCAELGGFRGWSNTPTPGCYTAGFEVQPEKRRVFHRRVPRECRRSGSKHPFWRCNGVGSHKLRSTFGFP